MTTAAGGTQYFISIVYRSYCYTPPSMYKWALWQRVLRSSYTIVPRQYHTTYTQGFVDLWSAVLNTIFYYVQVVRIDVPSMFVSWSAHDDDEVPILREKIEFRSSFPRGGGRPTTRAQYTYTDSVQYKRIAAIYDGQETVGNRIVRTYNIIWVSRVDDNIGLF